MKKKPMGKKNNGKEKPIEKKNPLEKIALGKKTYWKKKKKTIGKKNLLEKSTYWNLFYLFF